MTLDIQRAAAKRMQRIVISLVVLVVVLAGGIIALVFGGSGGGPSPSPAPPSPTPSVSFNPSNAPAPMPTETTDGTYVAPSAWVTLPVGGDKKDGYPIHFPHNVDGAAAAAVAAVRAGWTWNPDASAKAAGVYSDPSETAEMEDAARQAVSASRTSLGLPSTGALPAGASLSVAPIGVQWSGSSADQVTVSVLSRVVYTTGSGVAQQTQVIASTAPMVWVGGDWHTKSQTDGSGMTAPQPFDLGTSGFNSAGWRAIQQGDSQ